MFRMALAQYPIMDDLGPSPPEVLGLGIMPAVIPEESASHMQDMCTSRQTCVHPIPLHLKWSYRSLP